MCFDVCTSMDIQTASVFSHLILSVSREIHGNLVFKFDPHLATPNAIYTNSNDQKSPNKFYIPFFLFIYLFIVR